jgi:hypothetical protein
MLALVMFFQKSHIALICSSIIRNLSLVTTLTVQLQHRSVLEPLLSLANKEMATEAITVATCSTATGLVKQEHFELRTKEFASESVGFVICHMVWTCMSLFGPLPAVEFVIRNYNILLA